VAIAPVAIAAYFGMLEWAFRFTEDTTAALPITPATLPTAGTLITGTPIIADIGTVRTGMAATRTDTGPTIMARLIRPTITGASIAVTADQLWRACKNGSPALDFIAARSMA
jgi:hypothetical protein